MSKQFKNLVSSSGECHQTNPLTGFATGTVGQAVKMRVISGSSSSPMQQLAAHPNSATNIHSQHEVSQFYNMQAPTGPVSGIQPSSGWVEEFGRVSRPISGPPQVQYRQSAPMLGQFGYMPHFAQPMMAPVYTPHAPVVSGPDVTHATSGNDDLAAAKRMVELLRNSGNPKFANSTFVDFIDQVASGDLAFRGNEVVDRDGKPVDWDAVYDDDGGQLGSELLAAGDDAENLPDQMERIWNELRGDNEWLRSGGAEYEFQHSTNKYIESENPLEIAIRLIKEGKDSEAVVALEAEVRVHPNSSEGWRLLGQLNAQFDRDVDAIKCLESGHRCDAFNLDSMLALGVSLTNELDSIRAMEILKQWLGSNEKFMHIVVPEVQSTHIVPDFDFTRIKKEVLDLFNQAAVADPSDPDIAVALGVLHNINRDYALAISSLLRAAELRPTDFTVWNKLGATLANSGLSREAMQCYHQALSIKPNYARAWSNLAIAHTNMEEYADASNFFLTAIQLSPGATHLWSSLLIALSNHQPTNDVLSDLIDRRDVAGLAAQLPGAPQVAALPAPRLPSDAEVRSIISNLRQNMTTTTA